MTLPKMITLMFVCFALAACEGITSNSSSGDESEFFNINLPKDLENTKTELQADAQILFTTIKNAMLSSQTNTVTDLSNSALDLIKHVEPGQQPEVPLKTDFSQEVNQHCEVLTFTEGTKMKTVSIWTQSKNVPTKDQTVDDVTTCPIVISGGYSSASSATTNSSKGDRISTSDFKINMTVAKLKRKVEVQQEPIDVPFECQQYQNFKDLNRGTLVNVNFLQQQATEIVAVEKTETECNTIHGSVLVVQEKKFKIEETQLSPVTEMTYRNSVQTTSRKGDKHTSSKRLMNQSTTVSVLLTDKKGVVTEGTLTAVVKSHTSERTIADNKKATYGRTRIALVLKKDSLVLVTVEKDTHYNGRNELNTVVTKVNGKEIIK